MYTCIRVQDRRAHIHASYMHVSGSCINARVMHHIYVHHGHVYQDQEYMHQTYIHHWMIKERVYMYHGYMHHVYIHQGQRLSMHDKYMHRTHVSGSMIIDVCIIHTCLRVKNMSQQKVWVTQAGQFNICPLATTGQYNIRSVQFVEAGHRLWHVSLR